ncbi:hypothetical protein MMC25_004875 [Agyrium rufum]|nr:hypothetical protein [Agyrium rufum]
MSFNQNTREGIDPVQEQLRSPLQEFARVTGLSRQQPTGLQKARAYRTLLPRPSSSTFDTELVATGSSNSAQRRQRIQHDYAGPHDQLPHFRRGGVSGTGAGDPQLKQAPSGHITLHQLTTAGAQNHDCLSSAETFEDTYNGDGYLPDRMEDLRRHLAGLNVHGIPDYLLAYMVQNHDGQTPMEQMLFGMEDRLSHVRRRQELTADEPDETNDWEALIDWTMHPKNV